MSRWRRGAGKELNQIPRLRRCLGPSLGRSGDQKLLEFGLALPQGLIEADLLEPPANLGVLLGIHAAVLVKLYRLVCHGLAAFFAA